MNLPKQIYSRTHPGAIVLLHPNSSTNTEILDEVLTHWEKEGYKLKTLDYLNNKNSIINFKNSIMNHSKNIVIYKYFNSR